MAKRRVKKHTHVGAAKGGLPAGHVGHAVTKPVKPGSRAPKSMVIRVGASEVGASVSQLVKDMRQMMGPDTASRLKERRSNKLRDYTTMAGPLGVSHLMLFSRSEKGNTNLRLALTPRGPTLHFRVEKYSLCKDIFQSQRRPKSGGSEYLTAPLLVMNNFATKEGAVGESTSKVPKHLESLTTSIFQSLFPPINPTATPLNGIKRVLLLDRLPQDPEADTASYVLNLRHYAIETRTAKSVPKPLRKLDAAEKLGHAGQKRKRALPNLGKLNDVADYLLDPHAADGFTSGSESEPETDAEVEIEMSRQRKVQKNGKKRGEGRDPKENVERKAIKLYEIGPRLKLRLTKVEEGLCNGKVMWHEYIHKTKEEIKEMEKVHQQRRMEKEKRKAEQKANVEKKKAEKAARKARGEKVEDSEEDEEMEELEDEDDDEWDDEGLEDDEYAGPGADEDGDEELREGGSEDEDEAG
jgi:ribosome biogenesis protein SSF1/2